MKTFRKKENTDRGEITLFVNRIGLRKEAFGLGLTAVLSTAKDLGGVFALSYATDQIIYNKGNALQGLLIMIVVMFLGVGIATWEQKIHATFLVKCRRILYTKFLESLLTADISPETVGEHKEWNNIYSGDVPRILQWFDRTYTGMIKLTAYLLGALIYSLFQNVILTVIVIPIACALVPLISRISNKLSSHAKAERKAADEALKKLDEILDDPEYIKAYSIEDAIDEKMNDILKRRLKAEKKSNHLKGPTISISSTAGYLPGVAAGVIGGYFLYRGWITVGFLIAFIQMVMGRFQYAFPQIGNFIAENKAMTIYAQRYNSFIRLPKETRNTAYKLDTPDRQQNKNSAKQPLVEFKNVTFEYEEGNPILSNVNFRVNKGEHVAFVGESGSGKTTILKLIMGYYHDQNSYKGEIWIAGKELREWNPYELRQKIAPVFQNSVLFQESLKQNILMAAPGITDSEIQDLLNAVGLSLEMAEKNVGEKGGALSGGEKQRVSIARALAKNTDLFLLDEFTSALDTMTEEKLMKELSMIMKDRTYIMISHRMSTVAAADRTLLLKNGKLEEETK